MPGWRLRDPMVLANELATLTEAALRDDESAALEQISAEYAKRLTMDLEYIVLMSPEARTYVHTNKLREGRVYADEANLAAAAVRSPSLRPYERNTGEVIREAVVPVMRDGEHYAVVRVGQIVPDGSLRRRVVGSLAATAGIPAVLEALSASWTDALLSAGVGIALAAALGVWNWRRISDPLRHYHDAARRVMAGDLTATVEGAGRDELGQVGFEFNKVVLGLRRMIETGQGTASHTAELATDMIGAAQHSSTSLAEVAATVDQVATKAAAHATETCGVAETAGELAHGAASVAEACRAAGEMAAGVQSGALSGRDTAQATAEAMSRIQESVSDVARVIGSLGERSGAIGQIVAAIEEIAEQTNLLALNAAIEAARAGEAGKGFAVVADEVRGLAESTRAQTESIAGLIGEIQSSAASAVSAMGTTESDVNAGVAQVESAQAAFADIHVSVEQLVERMSMLAESAERIDTESTDIQRHIAALAEGSREHAAAAEQVAAAARETGASTRGIVERASDLECTAHDLNRTVGLFTVS
ncbi:MAG: methyl-accepting chemotaxis protein [Actinobacteria bacterium]|nr:methyl-accepting chemotaxis protein [Thermoleophilia bacterium]MCB9011892.1 methyl-accepting chemotaxis protein [Actinomycetota bacterium]